MIFKNALHLFVYQLSETEFYTDLAHPFGHITSEFCFHSITAVIQWATAFIGVATPQSPVSNFVDNWFMIGRADDTSFATRSSHLELALVNLGAERQVALKDRLQLWRSVLHIIPLVPRLVGSHYRLCEIDERLIAIAKSRHS